MLHIRVLELMEYFGLKKSICAKKLGLTHKTFAGYLKPEGEHNLWQLLPNFLEWHPDISREWLYFGEGDMLAHTPDTRPTYPDDVLERIAILTGIRATSALQLQKVFGADFKEIKPWLSKYMQARIMRDEWRASGGQRNEYDTPPPFPDIPEEWLYFFWTNYGPNPTWVQYGERRFGGASLLTEQPRTHSQARAEKSEQEKTNENQDNLLHERVEKLEREHINMKENVNVMQKTHADTNLSVSCVTVEENIN